jgi:hypothetical protein
MDIQIDSKMPTDFYRLPKNQYGRRCLMKNILELKTKSQGWPWFSRSRRG